MASARPAAGAAGAPRHDLDRGHRSHLQSGDALTRHIRTQRPRVAHVLMAHDPSYGPWRGVRGSVEVCGDGAVWSNVQQMSRSQRPSVDVRGSPPWLGCFLGGAPPSARPRARSAPRPPGDHTGTCAGVAAATHGKPDIPGQLVRGIRRRVGDAGQTATDRRPIAGDDSAGQVALGGEVVVDAGLPDAHGGRDVGDS